MKTPHKHVPWSPGDRLLMIVLGVLVVGVSLGVWSHGRDRTPDLIVPTPILPSPNAFDYYLQAGTAITGGAIISPSAPNQPINPTAAQAAVVRQNAAPNGAVSLLHQGFQYPCHGPVVRSFSALFPQYQKVRALARLLALQARVDAAQGDWTGAMTADLDCIRLGEDTARGSGLIGMLVGSACESIGRRQAWKIVNHLTLAEARAAAQRLESIRTRHVPYADTMQESEWSDQAGLLEMMRLPGWPDGVTQGFSGSGNQSLTDTLSNWKTATIIRATGKKAILSNVTHYLDQKVANARQPYAAHLPDPTPPSDPISRMMFSSDSPLDRIRLNETRADTENALLLTLLALRAYKLDRGAYPTALSALVPGYLKTVPSDPFALSGPLRYKRTAGSFLLYSVGPDGKDDGGKPIFDATKSAPSDSSRSDQRYYVVPESQGDIVAGVNVS